MYYKLKENFLLRGWEKLPCALVNKQTGRPLFIRAEEMDALMLCDGALDLSLPLIPQSIRDMIPVIEEKGIIEACQPGDSIAPEQEYRLYPARYIRQAHWSVTGKCNYKCRHCYMSAPDAKLGELDHNAVMDIVQQLSDCGIMNVSLTGGEPLIRPDFMDIVDALLERDIRITTIYSNGKLVTGRLLSQLEERGLRPEFNMSFDGVGHHDWLRGIPGAEKTAEEAFLRCKERGFPTGAEMCIHQQNKHTIRQTINALASWGCTHIKINPVSNVGAWRESGYGEAMSMEELNQLYLDYIPQYYEDGMPLRIMLGGFFMANPKNPGQYGIPAMKICKNPDTMCVCGHARQVMYISAEGRTLPCMALSGMDVQTVFPLITEQGLSQCITDSRYMRLINTRASEYFERNPACKSCEYATSCTGGCRASAFQTSGDIMGPDKAACHMFRGGWIPRIIETVTRIRPGAKCLGLPEGMKTGKSE